MEYKNNIVLYSVYSSILRMIAFFFEALNINTMKLKTLSMTSMQQTKKKDFAALVASFRSVFSGRAQLYIKIYITLLILIFIIYILILFSIDVQDNRITTKIHLIPSEESYSY